MSFGNSENPKRMNFITAVLFLPPAIALVILGSVDKEENKSLSQLLSPFLLTASTHTKNKTKRNTEPF